MYVVYYVDPQLNEVLAGKTDQKLFFATPGRPTTSYSAVCRSCQETLTISQRNYASAASTAVGSNASDPQIPPASNSEAAAPSFTIKAGIVLSRPPQITRDLTPFEKSFFFYQKRLNERLALPFTRYFYFKRGTPADEDWKRKYKERLTPSRDIGKYNAYSPDAWNDELLVGAVESEPDHQVEMLLRDAEVVTTASSEGSTTKKVDIERPAPRVTEADKKNDHKSLDRLLQRTLYLLVQTKEGYWKFPSSPVGLEENLRSVRFSFAFFPFSHYISFFLLREILTRTKWLITNF